MTPAAQPTAVGFKYFLAGGLGDATAALVSHPLDVLKVRRQLRGELSASPRRRVSLLATARAIVRAEGAVAGLYRGLSASLLRQAVFSTLRHGWYASLCAAAAANAALSPSSSSDRHASAHSSAAHPSASVPLGARVALGCGAGAAAAALANPADVVLVRMQARRRERHRIARTICHCCS